ncbi:MULTISPECIES: nitrile hydratase subunit alpha [unclassified Paenibacillus]|uniref:nitrile hydratase subunit alpha n=1 Tax=unclassified Paenibacillus TaxID=185978 RepID=UPI0024071D72|nr:MULTISPECIES: nitrile hydratase subunit alpha [unclassified Paenibacillus]MDF9839758.1 nitrile hydratase [Paenibacillus sp. PastF-2]MDF9846338.1 nitrile hydratase [Paenibacillus sp. PastM-2]MDF9853312.1 nitrile hydratase [Paenibacillus sp. PastF-1]MDH6478184.1 nitrile hydratase [Paenibacillus sp. PastH-2]MDH6506317.1 nitrile hydratase [Paenibacillus sp. PastM-3]
MTAAHTHDHSHDHDHGHHHDHDHPHTVSDSFEELRTMAIESLLIEKGLISMQEIDELIRYYSTDVGPMHGAKLVAKAWTDPEFKQRLLENGKKAAAELNLESELIVLENKPGIHNVVVCTLCSCYPWALLGLPPTWYKSTAYRSRVVIDPRSVLQEFGLELGEDTEIRVWDSNAEVRYLVMPERPPGTEHLSEEELAALISRDSMIGVAR